MVVVWQRAAAAVMAILLAARADAQKEALSGGDQAPAGREQKGVYGTDDRTDETRAGSCVGEGCDGSIATPLRSIASESTVALIPRRKLSYDARTNSWVPRSSMTLGDAFNMCPIDPVTGTATRFINQPTPASCSGTVVQWDPLTKTGLVASAAHCFDDDGATNGCQNSQGELIDVPERGADCVWAGDGECDEGLDGFAAYCPVGSDSEDCGERQEVESECPFLFVFDFTDESIQAAPATVVPDDCPWAADGECDVPRYCPANSDLCDCSGVNCPQATPPTFSIPASNVYDCAEIVLCDIENLHNDWSVGSADGSFTDFALARIVADGISSTVETCAWENDGECDVPTYCPAGTDTTDCRSEDSDALRAARTTDFSHLTRELLDGGSPRSIVPAPMYSGVLGPGTPLTVVGHPSGLPRKYTGGATVHEVAECVLDTLCPAGGADWGAYTADLDTFGGNSGSGTFTDSGEMVGILISGATDFYHRVGNYGAGSSSAVDSCAYAADGECDAGTYCAAGSDVCDCTGEDCPEQACMLFARCEDGLSSGHCRWYDTSVRFPAACLTDATSAACYQVCEGAGLEWVSCSGENVAPTAGLINYIQNNPYQYPAGTFAVVDTTVAPVGPVTPAPGEPVTAESILDLLAAICPAELNTCLASTACQAELTAVLESGTEEPPVDATADLLALAACVDGEAQEPDSAQDELWDGEGDNPNWDAGWGGCDTYAEGEPNHSFCIMDGADIECPVACVGAVPLADTLEALCPSEVAVCQDTPECAVELEEWLETVWVDPSASSEAIIAVQTCFYGEGEPTALDVVTEYCPDEVLACNATAGCADELEAAVASGGFALPATASTAMNAIATCFQQPCSGGITFVDSGTLAHGNLMDLQECIWDLHCSDTSLAPTLTFTEFHTEAHYDFLHIFDWEEGSGNSFALHGSTIPDGSLAVSGPSATVVYSSDGSVNGDGFHAEFVCGTPAPLQNSEVPQGPQDGACGGEGAILTDGGTIAHTGSSVDHDQFCQWELRCSTAEHVPQLHFSTFHTESWYDFVVLYDGLSFEELGYLHGTTTPDDFEGVTSSMYVEYVSDGSISGEGFAANFTCQDSTAMSTAGPGADPCTTGVTLTDSGTIVHTSQTHNAHCTWVMECSDEAMVPQVTIATLHTESNYDYLYVFDSPDSTGPAHSLHGTEVPAEPIVTSQSGAFVRYTSDGSISGEGFHAEFECVPQPTLEYSDDPCEGGGVQYVDNASIDFVPLEYDQDCRWTVLCSDTTQVPELTFTAFDTEQSFDYVHVYDSSSDTGESIAFHGTDVPNDPLAASGPAGHLRYISDYSVNGLGFRASIECVDGAATGGPVLADVAQLEEHERACDGGIEVNAGDAVALPFYGPDASCSWAISCPFPPAVLTFTDLDIEQGWDFIYLYDGEDSTAAPIGEPISGVVSDGWPEPQTASGTTMFVLFESDGSVQRPGFAAFASCPNQEPTFCGTDEHVEDHICHHCDPGTENSAGDDASGPDTYCSPITCGVNERVADNMCIDCDPGKVNQAGNDASGSDTECALIPTTGMCAGNTESSEDIECLEADGVMAKPDPETIACGESCNSETCCDTLPPTPPEVWYLWEATAFESCPAMVCGARDVTRTVQCMRVSIFSTGAVTREVEVLAGDEITSCEEAERPSTTFVCPDPGTGSPCDDGNPDTTNDQCNDDAQCLGVVALVSAVTFDIPVENLELPDQSGSVEDIDVSPIALEVKSSLRPVLQVSFGVRQLTDDSIKILRIQAGSLEVDYKVELPPEAATEEAKDAAVAAIADPEAAGLRPDAMALTLTDTTGREVSSSGALPQQFHTYSYVRAGTCPAGQQPGINTADCSNECGTPEVNSRDSWRCLQDGASVHPYLCEHNGLGVLPVTYTQCCGEPEDGTCILSDAAEVEAARIRQCDELEGVEERLVCKYGEGKVEQAKMAAFVFLVIAVFICLCCGAVCIWCCLCKARKEEETNAAEGSSQGAGSNAAYADNAETTGSAMGGPPQYGQPPVVVAVPLSAPGAGPPGFGAPPTMPPAAHSAHVVGGGAPLGYEAPPAMPPKGSMQPAENPDYRP